MDTSVYLIGGVIVVLAIIILNHQRQKNKMHNFLQSSGDMQPMFLLKSVEKKIKALSDILYEDGIKLDSSSVSFDDVAPNKKPLIKALETLQKEYAAKKIPLRTYDEQLFDLLEKAKKLPVNA